MALNPSNSSNLEELVLKGLNEKCRVPAVHRHDAQLFYTDRMKMHDRNTERYHGNEVAVVTNLMKQVQSLISNFTLTWSTRPQ